MWGAQAWQWSLWKIQTLEAQSLSIYPLLDLYWVSNTLELLNQNSSWEKHLWQHLSSNGFNRATHYNIHMGKNISATEINSEVNDDKASDCSRITFLICPDKCLSTDLWTFWVAYAWRWVAEAISSKFFGQCFEEMTVALTPESRRPVKALPSEF